MPAPSPLPKCTAFLYLSDESGAIGSNANAVLVVELEESFVSGGFVVAPFRRTYAFDYTGFVQTTASFLQPPDASVTDGLVETQTLGISPYKIGVQYNNGAGEFVTALTTSNIQIPNTASVDLSTLLITG